MAMLIQMLSAKLGIATSRNLAEVAGDQTPAGVVVGSGSRRRRSRIATDLAEFLGARHWLHLLFGIALLRLLGITAVCALRSSACSASVPPLGAGDRGDRAA